MHLPVSLTPLCELKSRFAKKSVFRFQFCRRDSFKNVDDVLNVQKSTCSLKKSQVSLILNFTLLTNGRGSLSRRSDRERVGQSRQLTMGLNLRSSGVIRVISSVRWLAISIGYKVGFAAIKVTIMETSEDA